MPFSICILSLPGILHLVLKLKNYPFDKTEFNEYRTTPVFSSCHLPFETTHLKSLDKVQLIVWMEKYLVLFREGTVTYSST